MSPFLEQGSIVPILGQPVFDGERACGPGSRNIISTNLNHPTTGTFRRDHAVPAPSQSETIQSRSFPTIPGFAFRPMNPQSPQPCHPENPRAWGPTQWGKRGEGSASPLHLPTRLTEPVTSDTSIVLSVRYRVSMTTRSLSRLKSQIVTSNSVLPPERVERLILSIRAQKVMLSTDLAELYKVAPKVLVQAVKRNRERFPADFMFQLTRTEYAHLKSQFVTSSW
jgi:ORF6N domain